MRPEGILKHFIAALIIAVAFYFVTFKWIEGRRAAHGPWQITFQSDAAGVPELSISESNLEIQERIRFPHGHATSNLSRTISFRDDTPELPFGEMLFQDPTFLPGTVAMRLFGHQVQLQPRVLTIDGKEYPWRTDKEIDVP